MNKHIFFFLFLTLFSISAMAQTESQSKYYRYFTVDIENITQAEFDQLSTSRESTYLKFDNFCTTNALVLVTYDASVAKRIDDMIAEIKETISAEFPEKEISKVETVVYSDKTNFCK